MSQIAAYLIQIEIFQSRRGSSLHLNKVYTLHSVLELHDWPLSFLDLMWANSLSQNLDGQIPRRAEVLGEEPDRVKG